jgi:metallo-beta-lactamase class B
MTLKRTQCWLPVLIAIFLWGLASIQTVAQACSQCEEWNRPQKPFRIFGNSYYVGPHGLSSILITSSSGHILMDGALPQSARQIAANIQALGFRLQDVKLIVNSHVHFDHAGGIAELQRLSGASVVASPWSAAVLRHGGVGKGDPQYGEVRPIAAAKNVRELRDGQSFRIGETVITAHLTPGHTPGGTSWTWQSCEDKVCRNMVYADSLTPVSARGFRFSHSSAYPKAMEDFQQSFAFFEKVPCDILVTTHPENSRLWDRLSQREAGVSSDPFLDRGACQRLADSGRETFRQRLAEERESPGARQP